jgi:Phosphoribulokinase / Uridine kinase family
MQTKGPSSYRPPWFTLQVIGIAGPSASGKTSVARTLIKKLNVPLTRASLTTGSVGSGPLDGLVLQVAYQGGVGTGV